MGCCLLLWETLLHSQTYWNSPPAITPTWRWARFQRFYEPQVCSVIRPAECSHSLPVITIQSGLAASEQTSSASLTTVVQHLATRESNSCCCCCLLQSFEVCRDLIKVHCDMLTTGWANGSSADAFMSAVKDSGVQHLTVLGIMSTVSM